MARGVRRLGQSLLLSVLTLAGISQLSAAEFASHPPVRPLPQAIQRALGTGPAKYVDIQRGDNAFAGTQAKPWKTIGHAVAKLQPGETLYLRAGTYYEHITATLVGTPGQPITIRAYPGELVTVDGGLPEFQLAAATAWEPCPGGVAGEFQSTKTYPDIETGEGDLRVNLLGNFVDSLLPLQGYWHRPDLQSDLAYWTIRGEDKVKATSHVYCGPGLWYNEATDRIHCRLAHTKLPALGDNNYLGETDPRRIPLIIAGSAHGPVFKLQNCRHVVLQDLVLRGTRQAPLEIRGGSDISLSGLTLYGGDPCLRAEGIERLHVTHTAFRGLAAPWTFRGSLKYRSIESRLVRTGGWDPDGLPGREYAFVNCEFTDSVDGVFIGNIRQVEISHSLVENISDDGIFLTANTGFDGITPGGPVTIFGNRFARTLTCLAFGVGHGRQKTLEPIVAADGSRSARKQLGGGAIISRNVFDLRGPVMYHWPTGPADIQEINSLGRFGGDHGSPAWESMWIYQNTFLMGEPSRSEYAAQGVGSPVSHGTVRRVFNNVFCQMRGPIQEGLPPTTTDFIADGNLFWSMTDGLTFQREWCLKFRQSPEFIASQQQYPPGWTAHDRYADPKFTSYSTKWPEVADVRLQAESPAVDAGVELPQELANPLRSHDAGQPDIGAIARGQQVPRIGCFGRFDLCGRVLAADFTLANVPQPRPPTIKERTQPATLKSAVIVTGYPAFDAPLVAFALRRARVPVVEVERAWLDPKEYSKYKLVVIDGSFTRANVTPNRFTADQLPLVRKFLEEGGTLWLFRDRFDIFADPAGRKVFEELIGEQPLNTSTEIVIKLAEHPWVKHLQLPGSDHAWLARGEVGPAFTNGEVILGTASKRTLLGRVSVGRGQIIYTGWSPAASLPHGRQASSVAAERLFEDQMRILLNIVETIYSPD